MFAYRRILCVLVVGFVLLMTAEGASARPAGNDQARIQEGIDAYQRGQLAKAFDIFGPLASAGHPAAQYYLGILNQIGRDLQPNVEEALRWFRKAAEQGHAAAQYQLGLLYYQGLLVPQDYVEAARWLRKAAEQGEPTAQYLLGVVYDEGRGLPRDVVQAYLWLTLAARHGYPPADVVRDRVAGKMTTAQMAEAQQLAQQWKPQS
ncbi:MAG: tetratricopeptide repeat protein, partial [Nitrospirales bacterium]